jgi:hypothetical protein
VSYVNQDLSFILHTATTSSTGSTVNCRHRGNEIGADRIARMYGCTDVHNQYLSLPSFQKMRPHPFQFFRTPDRFLLTIKTTTQPCQSSVLLVPVSVVTSTGPLPLSFAASSIINHTSQHLMPFTPSRNVHYRYGRHSSSGIEAHSE